MKPLIVIISSAATAAVIAVSALATIHVSQLQQENRQQSAEIVKLTRSQKDMQLEQSNLDSEIAGLTTPTDPLSAYNDICSSYQTNNQTQVSQPYFYPCTNQAQTIPMPGN